ncbi:F-box/LRR-repeat protein 17 [Anolis sagrei]|uniref:F-box/LRR-repeat protein 17 n=1 Tax=Anolis sagrei TaxID=38937 RepID=UPI003520B5C6
MGHFLSRKEGTGAAPGRSAEQSRLRRRFRLRRRALSGGSRGCFLRGPCMLCFLVHGAPEEPPQARRPSPRLLAALKEERGLRCPRLRRHLLLSGLLLPPPPPPPPPGRRGAPGPALESGQAPPEMVCKRKGVGLPACPPRKQPRCAAIAAGPDSAAPPLPPPAQLACPLPSASEPREPAASENGAGRALPAEGARPQAPRVGGEEEEEEGEEKNKKGERRQQEPRREPPDCEEPPENPGDCCSRGEPPGPTPDINQLPPSILLKIFSNLSLNERCLSASLVCKYWRDLCLDFQFWKQLDLSSRQQVTDELLERIASRSQNITEINISDCRNVSDTGVCVLASKCPGLLRYTAYRCKQLSDTSIIAVASQCPQLQKVHVGNQDRLTDEGLKQLGSECRELKDIHFGQCYKISDEGMIIIAKGCLKLQRIYMQENKLVTDQSVKAFAEHCPELQYVGFMGCSVTSKGVIHLTNLRNLSSLDLRHITELDNETVMEIVKRCKNLTSLNLCLNWIINDRCVEVIAKEGQNLKELYLVSCKITDYALIAIGRYSMTIETVDVGWCKEITDQGATQIAQSSKSLRYLGLMRCDKVNEVTVEQLVQQHPHITFSTVLQDCKRTLERAYQMGWTPNMSTAS